MLSINLAVDISKIEGNSPWKDQGTHLITVRQFMVNSYSGSSDVHTEHPGNFTYSKENVTFSFSDDHREYLAQNLVGGSQSVSVLEKIVAILISARADLM